MVGEGNFPSPDTHELSSDGKYGNGGRSDRDGHLDYRIDIAVVVGRGHITLPRERRTIGEVQFAILLCGEGVDSIENSLVPVAGEIEGIGSFTDALDVGSRVITHRSRFQSGSGGQDLGEGLDVDGGGGAGGRTIFQDCLIGADRGCHRHSLVSFRRIKGIKGFIGSGTAYRSHPLRIRTRR